MSTVNMKKVALRMFCLIGFSLPVFATPNDQPFLYCPHHITCTIDGQLDSCKVSDNQYGAWGTPYNYGRVSQGVYVLKKVITSYQSPDSGTGGFPQGQETNCNYKLIDNKNIEKKIIVYKTNQVPFSNGEEWTNIFFEASFNNNSQWNISGWEAECLSDDPLVCPLAETPEIALISNGNVRTFYWNDKQIYSYPRISYNNLLNLCGPIKECKISIGEGNYNKYKLNGVVTVNTTKPDHVQIVNIETVPSSSCLLKKIEPFNTIYCEPIKKS